ncbi:FAD-dependent monooxygenase, partial [Vibrio breoganii]
LLCPEKLDVIEFGEINIVKLQSGAELSAKWVVGADGANSAVRQQAGIGITAWDYRQHCMLINVETEQPQQDITWQQFLPSGPRSFLPLCSL